MPFLALLCALVFPSSSLASICEHELVDRVVVWRVDGRSVEMSHREFEFVLQAIKHYNREYFASVSKPRIFEVKSKGGKLRDAYSRSIFRIALGESVNRMQAWDRESATKEWLGFHEMNALYFRKRNIGSELALLNELLQSEDSGPRVEDYAKWKLDSENELQSVMAAMTYTEGWMEVRLPDDEMLPSLQEFFVEFIRVMAADDNISMRYEARDFARKEDAFTKARQLLGTTYLNGITVESPRSFYTRVVLQALMDASNIAMEGSARSLSSVAAALAHQLEFYIRYYQAHPLEG